MLFWDSIQRSWTCQSQKLIKKSRVLFWSWRKTRPKHQNSNNKNPTRKISKHISKRSQNKYISFFCKAWWLGRSTNMFDESHHSLARARVFGQEIAPGDWKMHQIDQIHLGERQCQPCQPNDNRGTCHFFATCWANVQHSAMRQVRTWLRDATRSGTSCNSCMTQ